MECLSTLEMLLPAFLLYINHHLSVSLSLQFMAFLFIYSLLSPSLFRLFSLPLLFCMKHTGSAVFMWKSGVRYFLSKIYFNPISEKQNSQQYMLILILWKKRMLLTFVTLMFSDLPSPSNLLVTVTRDLYINISQRLHNHGAGAPNM